MADTDVMPPKVWAFYSEQMQSATGRKMAHIGMVLTKVAAMFGTEKQPQEAMAIFVLLLEGLESGDSRYEARAMGIYRECMARREVH